MENISEAIQKILIFLNENRGFEFSGYRESMLQRRIKIRISAINCATYTEYLMVLKENPEELNHLIDTLTINVSRFFRNTLTFEYIADIMLPLIIASKNHSNNEGIRIWCAGCATGEEPYSIAILINELFRKEHFHIPVYIFATDINANVITKAKLGVYPFESIKNMKYRLVDRYFTKIKDGFELVPEIKIMVHFSIYDMLSKKTYVPSESVYGHFDLVLCRNVLIYFNAIQQQLIFEKLYRSLSQKSYLILGEAESPPNQYQGFFKKLTELSHIYQKY
ncbi:MAG: protein-glutamate O-methyltransferase CheR [Desulfobacterales bacterium]|nr:protein-glutamate O-methyltransferase CheR [Desulfobacterales bacterium]